MQARRPLEGIAPVTLVAIAALGLYTLMTLLSGRWSHANGRALIAFDLAWLYLLSLVVFGAVRTSARDLRWLIRGLVIGSSIVCLAGLASRVLPNVVHTTTAVAEERLSYPVTYWNAFGLLAALGIVLAFHLTCTLTEHRLVQVLAAALLPLLGVTLYFTLSRGPMAAGAIGLAVYVLFARPRGLLSGALASAPFSAIAVVAGYHAKLLNSAHPTTPAAISQGHHVALVAGICALAAGAVRLALALVLDPRLRRLCARQWMRPATRRTAIAGTIAVALTAMLVLGAPHTLAHDWRRFISGAATPSGNNLRQRLTDVSDDKRTSLWKVALRGFEASPLHGHGAGMFQTLWDRSRPNATYTINAHSLYLQAMAELGVPGLALLLVLVGAVLVGLAVRARGAQRSLYGALLAAAVIWIAARRRGLGLGDAGCDARFLRRGGRSAWSSPRAGLRLGARYQQPHSPRSAVPGDDGGTRADHRLSEPTRWRQGSALRLTLCEGRLGRAVFDQLVGYPPRTV